MQRYTNRHGSASISIGSALCLVLTMAACTENEAPTSLEPSDVLTAQQRPAAVVETGNGAVVERGEDVFTFDQIIWLECVGEYVRAIVYAPYSYHLVLTPTGDFIYHDLWKPQDITGTLTGQSSGIIWTRARNVSPFISRSTGGGMEHMVGTVLFTSETGPDLLIHEVYHSSQNANEEVTAEFYLSRCKIK